MHRSWGSAEENLPISPHEISAIATLCESLKFDPLSQPVFWEHLVARIVDGQVTPRSCPHDVEVTIWNRRCFVEVKFSQAFTTVFRPIRGKQWTRTVFKWALPRGHSGKRGADVVVLIGRDVDRRAFSWVVPIGAINEGCASITVTAPSARSIGTWSRWDEWHVPFDVILPAVARVCHNTEGGQQIPPCVEAIA